MKIKKTGTIAIVAAAMIGSLVFSFSHSAAVEAVYPVEKAFSVISRRVGAWVSGFFNGAAAQLENVRLKREVASLSMIRSDFDYLANENERLRSALNYVKKAPGQWLVASVLSSGGGSVGIEKTIRVDKGSLNGVCKGAIVAVPEGLVGRVQNVTPHASEILLISSSKLKVSCFIEGVAGVAGILSGGSADLLLLKHIHSATSPAPRSRVLTSGLGGVFPAGIPVGTLLSCDIREEVASREGEVLPAVDFSTLEDVFIRCEK